jgi:putative transposase
MANYIRYLSDNPHAEYFLTLVTNRRRPFFDSPVIRSVVVDMLQRSADDAKGDLIAWVVLPDHIHILIRQGNHSFSRWIQTAKRRITFLLRENKAGFGEPGLQKRISAGDGKSGIRNRISAGFGEPGLLWQPRFWEHKIRDEADRIAAVEYIHFNPVRHGYVSNPVEWASSSFGRYIKEGIYPSDWSFEDESKVEHRFGE